MNRQIAVLDAPSNLELRPPEPGAVPGCYKLALNRRGRYGLVFLDAHSDFQYPQNAQAIGAAAGEDPAIVTGRGAERLINLEGRAPYIQDEDVILIGVRDEDEYLDELTACSMSAITSARLAQVGVQQAGTEALAAHPACRVSECPHLPWPGCALLAGSIEHPARRAVPASGSNRLALRDVARVLHPVLGPEKADETGWACLDLRGHFGGHHGPPTPAAVGYTAQPGDRRLSGVHLPALCPPEPAQGLWMDRAVPRRHQRGRLCGLAP